MITYSSAAPPECVTLPPDQQPPSPQRCQWCQQDVPYWTSLRWPNGQVQHVWACRHYQITCDVIGGGTTTVNG